MKRRSTGVLGKLLTASKKELLDGDNDRTLRTLLHDYFAFAHCLEQAREKFANFIGLSPSQYMMLIAIAQQQADEPLGISHIAKRMHMSGAFVTIEVNKLVERGLVEKSAHPGDARRVQLSVTPQCLKRLIRLAEFQRPVNDQLFGTLNRKEFEQVSRLLSRLAASGDKAVKLAAHLQATMDDARNLR